MSNCFTNIKQTVTMDDDKLHILITSETGTGRTLLIKKKSIRNLILSAALITVVLFVGTVAGLHQRKNRINLQHQVTALTEALESETVEIQDKLIAESNNLKKALAETTTELAQNKLEKQQLAEQYEKLQHEQSELFEGSISRLDERSKIIKTLMNQIGVKIEVDDDPDHSGGLYVDPDSALCDKLICETDRYLSLIKQLPLGRPIGTKISSKYGPRSDPFNKKKAFHTGIDFKGNTGDKIQATGDAVVKKSAYNKGLGNHVILKHGNGYTTLYAHLSKRLVKRGEKVVRGQTIGLLGNTGRSTGSHLHYEVHYRNKTVDPMKFMQVAKLIAGK